MATEGPQVRVIGATAAVETVCRLLRYDVSRNSEQRLVPAKWFISQAIKEGNEDHVPDC
jgi:hypothetical protein